MVSFGGRENGGTFRFAASSLDVPALGEVGSGLVPVSVGSSFVCLCGKLWGVGYLRAFRWLASDGVGLFFEIYDRRQRAGRHVIQEADKERG